MCGIRWVYSLGLEGTFTLCDTLCDNYTQCGAWLFDWVHAEHLPLNQEASNSLLQTALTFLIFLVITSARIIPLSWKDRKSGLETAKWTKQCLSIGIFLHIYSPTLPPILSILILTKLVPAPFLLTSRKPHIFQRFSSNPRGGLPQGHYGSTRLLPHLIGYFTSCNTSLGSVPTQSWISDTDNPNMHWDVWKNLLMTLKWSYTHNINLTLRLFHVNTSISQPNTGHFSLDTCLCRVPPSSCCLSHSLLST